MNPQRKPKNLLDQVRDALRVKHYAYRTEKAYIFRIRRCILFHGKRHPKDMGVNDIQAFLDHLAVNRNVSASTQNQAPNAIIFLYKKVLRIDLVLNKGDRAVRSPIDLPSAIFKFSSGRRP